MRYLLPIASPDATLPVAGGKGTTLARLITAGFDVPGGFIITTAAYDAFVAANRLAPIIRDVLAGCADDDLTALHAAATCIRAQFGAGQLPSDLANTLRSAYLDLDLDSIAVAVRSSATTEDTPDLSFAGQQDTFLNVVGPESLLRAVVDCWSSLWTARAIGYRTRNGIAHEDVSLAVVIQQMVQSEAAGVLFSANPLTGHRGETVIDAVAGLGDALLSGQIEPDHLIIETVTGRVLVVQRGGRNLGARPEPTEDAVVEEIGAGPALPGATVTELVALGRRVQAYFGEPQDIEWAWADGRLWLLQARPITSLYPLPDALGAVAAKTDQKTLVRVLASFGTMQGVPAPITPLGRDALGMAAAGFARVLGQPVTLETQHVLRTAGERIFIDITGTLRHGMSWRVLSAALRIVESASGTAIAQLSGDSHLALTVKPVSVRAPRQAALVLLPLAAQAIVNLFRLNAARRRTQAEAAKVAAYFTVRAAATPTLADRLALLDEITTTLPRFLLNELLPSLGAGMACLNLLTRLAQEVHGGRDLALRVTRGLPQNVIAEMDLALWEIAVAIRADPASAQQFGSLRATALVAAFQAGRLPETAQRAVAAFVARYGMRGTGEIDLGRPRWRDDPTPVIHSLQCYLQITDPDRAPDAVYARGAADAEAALAALTTALRGTRGGWLKARCALWAARRVRALVGLCGSSEFTFISLLGLLRTGLLDSGRELVAAGVLAAPGDIFFLRLPELATLSRGEQPDGSTALADRVIERRARNAREERRLRVPRLLFTDGRAFYGEVAAIGEGDLNGSPVSPGVVEGVVHVVLNPHQAQLQPGEILVCQGTDPAWAPLFLAAGGLVAEVGGLMTHGSVVAREYGIPAVVGVNQATRRLRTGQHVRVDGTCGRVILLEDELGQAMM